MPDPPRARLRMRGGSAPSAVLKVEVLAVQDELPAHDREDVRDDQAEAQADDELRGAVGDGGEQVSSHAPCRVHPELGHEAVRADDAVAVRRPDTWHPPTRGA